MTICESPLYSNQTICAVIEALDDLGVEATETKDAALLALGQLQAATESGISGMQSINYASGTGAINTTYAAPDAVGTVPDFSALGPTAPTFPTAPTLTGPIIPAAPTTPSAYAVPAATDLLITSATFDATFAREAARRARVGVKLEQDAVYRAGRLGIGKTAGALSIGLSEAEEKTNLDISSTAQDKAVAEGEWLRDDAKTLHGMHIQNWPLHPEIELKAYSAEEELGVEVYKAESGRYQEIVAGLATAFDAEVKWAIGYLQAESDRYRTFLDKYRADLASETERRGWSQVQIQAALDEADKATRYAIDKAQFILETSRDTAATTAQIIGTLAAAIYAAQDYNLSGRGSQSVSESA